MNIKPLKSGADLIGFFAMGDVTLQTLYKLWDDARGNQLAPFRAEVESSVFLPFAPITFQLEIQADIAKIRNAGKTLFMIAGSEPHSRPLVSLMSHQSRARLVRVIKHVLSAPAVAELVLSAQDSDGAECDANLLMMPLRNDFGVVDRILCGIALDAPHATQPLVLSITHAKLSTITDRRFEGQALPGFAEPAAPFAGQGTPNLHQVSDNPAAQPGVPRGRFRVIKGGLDDRDDDTPQFDGKGAKEK